MPDTFSGEACLNTDPFAMKHSSLEIVRRFARTLPVGRLAGLCLLTGCGSVLRMPQCQHAVAVVDVQNRIELCERREVARGGRPRPFPQRLEGVALTACRTSVAQSCSRCSSRVTFWPTPSMRARLPTFIRYTCGSWLAMTGAHPKVMRHQSITLTMDTCICSPGKKPTRWAGWVRC